MEKLDENFGKSEDIIANNIEQLKQLFPEAFTDGRIDFEVLKQLLGEYIDTNEEKYGLNWFGKKKARQFALIPSTGTLIPYPDQSEDWDDTKNLMIEGDNLEVMKILLKSYSGKIKAIYIDPPYNTGKDFVYKDDYKDNLSNYLEYTCQSKDGSLTTSNVERSGRFHTDWLNMIYPRLLLSRNLMTKDGVIFISIDDNEAPRLRCVCDEVFGEENFIAQLVWYYEGVNDNQYVFRKTHEYILVYAKDKVNTSNNVIYDPNIELNDIIENSVVKNGRANPPSTITIPQGFPCEIEKGLIRKDDVNSVIYDRDLSILGFRTVNEVKVTSGWSSKKILESFIESGFQDVIDINNQKTTFIIKSTGNIFYRKERNTAYLTSVLRNLGTTMNASIEISQLIGDNAGFSYPKPKGLIGFLLSIYMGRDDIALDFFAGSCTTAHSIMDLNALDNGKRKFIMVQLPEPIENSAGKYKTIFELGLDRIRKAGIAISSTLRHPAKIDIGFRVFRLDSSNIKAWDTNAKELEGTIEGYIEHIKENRSEQDILFELLLKLGLDLTVQIESRDITNKQVYNVGYGVLLVCLAANINNTEIEPLAHGMIEWIKEQNPEAETTIVFRDSAFADDIAKTNITAIFNQYGFLNIRSL